MGQQIVYLVMMTVGMNTRKMTDFLGKVANSIPGWTL
jgi:hypothetical protein